MLTELACSEKVVGAKQVGKAVRNGKAARVYLTCDADPALTAPVAESCRNAGVPVESGVTMAQLGQACGIAVGASVAAILAK